MKLESVFKFSKFTYQSLQSLLNKKKKNNPVWYTFFSTRMANQAYFHSQLAKLFWVNFPALCITIYGKWVFSVSCVYIFAQNTMYLVPCIKLFFYSLQSNSPTHSDTEEFLDVLHDIAGVCRRIATVIEKMKK